MQFNWDDLRILLAFHRAGTLAAAAEALGVDDTTVSRRLKALGTALGTQLTAKGASGTVQLTPEGEAAVERAEAMDLAASGLRASAADVAGAVRLTTVPILAKRLLLPQLPRFFADHPNLRLDLIQTNRDLNLRRREADLALRLGRPEQGGQQVVTRKLGTLSYSPFCALETDPASAPWIGYQDTMSYLPQAAETVRRAEVEGASLSPLRVHDAEMALEAAAGGMGRALLPSSIGKADPRLRCCGTQMLRRDVWLLGHRDLMPLARLQAVKSWLEGCV